MTRLSANDSLGAVADVLRNAAIFGRAAWHPPLAEGRSMPDPLPVSAERVVSLFRLLEDRRIPYLLVGGVAMLTYIDGRNTENIDLILPNESLAQLPEFVVADQNASFARARFDGLRVDVRLTANPLFRLIQDEYATTHSFHEQLVRVSTVEGLMLLKLYALPSLYRKGQGQRIAVYEADVMMLMQQYRPAVEPLLETLQKHVDSDAFSELQNIVRDIGERIARIDKATLR